MGERIRAWLAANESIVIAFIVGLFVGGLLAGFGTYLLR